MSFGKDLFDIIGVLIGFVMVMLLLSLIVTGTVQAIQAFFRLRSRNLKKGIEALLDVARGKFPDNERLAGNVLNSDSFAVLGKKKNPNNIFSRFVGSAVSYIDPSKLPEALYATFKQTVPKQTENDKINKNQIGKITNEYWPLLERQLEKQFTKYIRLITLICAFAVAFCFQVSAPDVLNKLSVDPNLRAKVLSEAMLTYEESGGKTAFVPVYRDVSEQALIEVEKIHPGLKEFESLEQFSGSGKTRYDILEEFNEVLEKLKIEKENNSKQISDQKNKSEQKTTKGLPDLNFDQVSKDYEAQLDKSFQEEDIRNKEQMRAALDMLGKFNIGFWQYGWSFYGNKSGIQWKNILGVLLTAILLSFGAPFWYKRLKDAIGLRDALSAGIKKGDEKKDNK